MSRVAVVAMAVSILGGAASSGCIVAAAAAGAGTGVYLTSRGAESLAPGSVDQVAARTQQVFGSMGIRPTGEKIDHDASSRELSGTKGELDITVRIERKDAGTSRVEVTAQRNVAEWDKDYAKDLLARIVAK